MSTTWFACSCGAAVRLAGISRDEAAAFETLWEVRHDEPGVHDPVSVYSAMRSRQRRTEKAGLKVHRCFGNSGTSLFSLTRTTCGTGAKPEYITADEAQVTCRACLMAMARWRAFEESEQY